MYYMDYKNIHYSNNGSSIHMYCKYNLDMAHML